MGQGIQSLNAALVAVIAQSSQCILQPTLDNLENVLISNSHFNVFRLNFFALYIAARANRLGARDSISLTAARNTDDFVPLLVRPCVRARLKVDVRAYLHWYEQYGCYQVCHLSNMLWSSGSDYAFD